eukprot:TRINITY_DN73293_c0_g1_i1.p1 TRINITY_DN73293_c0_g1~~TRINITY_DN73293_c0_g1_i1.p1  ORF type:complete len:108 (+),score=25.98 TRINITY_DN73293_c0_g1_i1:39-362(+)
MVFQASDLKAACAFFVSEPQKWPIQSPCWQFTCRAASRTLGESAGSRRGGSEQAPQPALPVAAAEASWPPPPRTLASCTASAAASAQCPSRHKAPRRQTLPSQEAAP